MSDENLQIKAMFVAAAFNALLKDTLENCGESTDGRISFERQFRGIVDDSMSMGQTMLDEFRKQEGWP